MMLTGQDRRREDRSRIMRVERLRHPETPAAIVAIIRTVRARGGGAGRSVPGDVDPPVIAGVDPGEDIHVERAQWRTRSVDLDGSRPGVSLVGRVGILE